MDPQLPSLRSLIGWTSATWQAHVASISSQGGTSEGSCSTSVLVQYMRLPQLKGPGIQLYPLPSTPFPQGVFSLMFSISFSIVTSHIIEFVVYSSQSLLWAFSESSSQRPQESQWHRNQFDRQYAMSCSRHRCGVRGTMRRRVALDANEAMTDSRPSATCATRNPLRSSPGLRMEASLSLHEATQGVCSLFSIGIMYVTSDIKANAPHLRFTAPTTDNRSQNKDAPHCIFNVLARLGLPTSPRSSTSSRFAAPVELRAFTAANRDDFFLVDVMRNAPPRLNEMVKISRSMNHAVHLDRLPTHESEYQI